MNVLCIVAQNRKIFAEQDAERAMIFILLSENDEVRVAACQALAVMAESMLSRETIRNNGLSSRVELLGLTTNDI